MPEQATAVVTMRMGDEHMLQGHGIQGTVAHVKSHVQFRNEHIGGQGGDGKGNDRFLRKFQDDWMARVMMLLWHEYQRVRVCCGQARQKISPKKK